MKKRTLGVILALCLLVGLLPITAYAETDLPVFYLEYAAPDTAHDDSVPGVRVEMKAGDEAKYWTTGEHDQANYAGAYFLKESDASAWNVKLEYPTDGIPTVTLKDAKIDKVYRGLSFIGGGETGGLNSTRNSTEFNGDVKLILEGSNSISGINRYAPALLFRVAGKATITGDGTLSINHSTNSVEFGTIHCNGDLVFDHAKIDITIPSIVISRYGNGIVAQGGDITFKGGSVYLDGHNQYPNGNGDTPYEKYRCIAYALWAAKDADGRGGTVNIQDNADVQIYASTTNATIPYYRWTKDYGGGVTSTFSPQVRGMVRIDSALNIKNSKVIFAITSGTYHLSGGFLEVRNDSLEVKQIGVKVNMEFDEGYTLVTSGSYTSYNAASGTFNLPTKSLRTYINETPDYATASSTPNFFMVTPGYEEPKPEPQPEPKPEPKPEPSTPTQPTEKPSVPENTTPESTTPATVPVTEPAKTEATEATDADTPDTPQEKKNVGTIVLIVALSVVVLAGAGAAVFIFVIKPKKK